MHKLILTSGTLPQKEFLLEEGEIFIGRDPACQIQLTSELVSKKHARIIVFKDEMIIEDLKSRNGTFVNGMMIQKQSLRIGDQISFGDIVLKLSLASVSERSNERILPNFDTSSKPLFKPLEKLFSAGQWIQEGFKTLVQVVEWRYFTLALFFILVLMNFTITVPLLLKESKTKLQIEALKRGEFIAKQVAQQNQKNLNVKNGALISDYLSLNLDLAKQEERVLHINIINPQTKRIIAPPERLDQSVENRGPFLRGADAKKLSVEKINDREVLISEPIYLYSSETDREVVGAIVQLVFNIDGIGLSSHEYLQTLLKYFIISLLIGLVFYFILQQYTITAFQRIYHEIESAFKKGYRHLELQTKFHEINQIIYAINRVSQKTRDLLAKIPRKDIETFDEGEVFEHTDEILKSLLDSSAEGIAIINSRYQVMQMNPSFQRIINLKDPDIENKSILDIIQSQELLRNISHNLGQASLGISTEEEVIWDDHHYQLAILASRNPDQEIDFYMIKLREGHE